MITTATGKTVLVTGGSRGIGAAIAIKLAGIGMDVVINYASNEDAANEVVRSITAAGGLAIAVKGDVSKSDQFAHLFDQAEFRHGLNHCEHGTEVRLGGSLPRLDGRFAESSICF